MPGSGRPSDKAATDRDSNKDSAAAKSSVHDDFQVVAVGASAGGLEAFRRLLDAFPPGADVALILVQHLDPYHESLLVPLLLGHSAMPVREAEEGMLIESGHVYVIAPNAYLSVANGAFHLSAPKPPHGVRLPFDSLLRSVADAFGRRAACVVLSGMGEDGSAGLLSVKAKGGLVIAQSPEEAAYAEMPQGAVRTGAVDLVLTISEIPAALAENKGDSAKGASAGEAESPDPFEAILNLLRAKTPHDFSFYKRGTLNRRIERRMAMASIPKADVGTYLEKLQSDDAELALLAKDLLINVTEFFRDAAAFAFLSDTVIPGLIDRREGDQPIRVWIAGCSTGQEAYSLAILFREAFDAAKCSMKLQVFASDVDPDAVATAREGLYPHAIQSEMSKARLERFFTKEDGGYRIEPELRASVVFTVQDVLADPPFSRLDLVSCRNLLIYLSPEGQAQAISVFHFALRPGGILVLGSAETPGSVEGRFEVVSKPQRVYRQIGKHRPGELSFLTASGDHGRTPTRTGGSRTPSRQVVLAELCKQIVLDAYAPAAVLINQNYECLYSLGPTDKYLRLALGHPSHDLISMSPSGVRAKLRAAIQQAAAENTRVVVSGGHRHRADEPQTFSITVAPVSTDGERLLVVCFVDEVDGAGAARSSFAAADSPQIAALEQELADTRQELHAAVRGLETSGEEQKAINEEALSVNEEFQSTNEELLTSKEELQSLNEELTALNGQLQETLDRQKITSDDLENILFSTDVATIFLDKELKIRFFTPATKSLFNMIASDIGRPLDDLKSLITDADLLKDARHVLKTLAPFEREIDSDKGMSFCRRILPYRTHADVVEGVVITFTDITDRKRSAKSLEGAKREAELANRAKSRFLAAASHDLRQPLQTLSLLQGLLAKVVEGKRASELLTRVEETVGSMTRMLNTVLDINQIEAGTVHAEITSFCVGPLLDRMREEFSYHAQAQHLKFRVVNSSAWIDSDCHLLEQILRNLISNALKYTQEGEVLVGCRRRGDLLVMQIWDTGIGIPADKLEAIFEEYNQLGNDARERSMGLGLGLSIVQRLGDLLGHKVHVRSEHGRGSVFSIEIAYKAGEQRSQPGAVLKTVGPPLAAQPHKGKVLVVEDDEAVRDLIHQILRGEGYQTALASNGPSALEWIQRSTVQPDLILADFNLPGGLNGIEVTTQARELLDRQIPVVILTADISTDSLKKIAEHDCTHLSKPVKLEELTRVIGELLADPNSGLGDPIGASPLAVGAKIPTIFIVDDDHQVRDIIRSVFEDDGQIVKDFASCEAFLAAYDPSQIGCLLVDAYLPGMTGLELLHQMKARGQHLPAVLMTGDSEVSIAVEAMRAGAVDFIEKPIGRTELLMVIARALEHALDATKDLEWHESAAEHIAGLTDRQREIMTMVLAGAPSKNIAVDLGISQRTVENHRASIMKKTGCKSLPALARLAMAAA